MRLVLDSSFIIDHLRGLSAAEARWSLIFERGDLPVVNEVVVCEVRSGLHPRDEAALAALLGPAEFLQPSMAAALRAGEWRAAARRRGHALSLADALIAAAADTVGAAVLTRNVRDFSLTPVPVETY